MANNPPSWRPALSQAECTRYVLRKSRSGLDRNASTADDVRPDVVAQLFPSKEDSFVSEPFIKMEYEHTMDADASRKHFADKIASNTYSIAGNQVSFTWDGDKANVSVAGAKGFIEFADKKVVLTVMEVPFAFRPMKGMIQGQIRGLIKQIIG